MTAVRSVDVTRPRALPGTTFDELPLRARDGTELALCRVRRAGGDGSPGPAVLLVHGLTASSDMFALSETRNLVAVLLDAGYEPWLLDWRGSCRLPYNDDGTDYSLDDVALHDLPEAVSYVRDRIDGRPLFAVAHCVGALALALSLTGGLVTGLAGVVAQGVFLTPKLPLRTRVTMQLSQELFRGRLDRLPIDLGRVGLLSKYAPLFALSSLGTRCPDAACRMLQSSWGMGGSLFVHENLDRRTHDRLAELFGSAPICTAPHLSRMEAAHSVVRWNDRDDRYRELPVNALDAADRIDCPVLLVSGSRNEFWLDSNRLCHDVLTDRCPQLDVRYAEIPGYGHLDAFIGRGAALDVFGTVVDFLDGLHPGQA